MSPETTNNYTNKEKPEILSESQGQVVPQWPDKDSPSPRSDIILVEQWQCLLVFLLQFLNFAVKLSRQRVPIYLQRLQTNALYLVHFPKIWWFWLIDEHCVFFEMFLKCMKIKTWNPINIKKKSFPTFFGIYIKHKCLMLCVKCWSISA